MTTARRTQQQRRDQAETALLNAAAELAVEHGVRSLTLARVGERAGYSRGIVTHHFGGKQALVERLARATQTGFVPGLEDVEAGIADGTIDGSAGAAEVATAVVGQLRGIALQRLLDPGSVDT